MNRRLLRSRFSSQTFKGIVAIVCVALLVPGDLVAMQAQQQQVAPATPESYRIPNNELDSLVAPIALYPDPLLSQTLVASTYPLEIIQLQQWLQKNPNLKDKALADAVQQQDWDPSIQAMSAFPDVVKQLAENIKWTTDLGNAFLAQQSDVMDAVQRMRLKAKDKGHLKSTEQQTVETRVIESKSVVVIEQASPEVVYIPSYDPMVVYGAPVYPYPAIAYPPGYYAAGMAISFGVGLAMGAAWGGGGWGWNCGWGGNNNININRNNNYVSHYNRQNANRVNNAPGSGNTWQHNPQHRGGAPYGDRATAKQYGGTSRGDALSNRQASARQNQGQFGNRQPGNRNPGGFTGRQEASGANRGSMGDRGSRSDFYNRGAGAGDFGGNRGAGGDRVGNQRVSGGGAGGGSGAFGGGGRDGFNGSSARASSARGASSMGARGGGSRGGGRRR